MVDDEEALVAALLLRAVEGDEEGEEAEAGEAEPHYDAALYADESDADEAGALDSHERLLYEAMAAADQSVSSPSTSSNTSPAPPHASSHEHGALPPHRMPSGMERCRDGKELQQRHGPQRDSFVA